MVMARSSGTNNKKRVDKQSKKGFGTKYCHLVGLIFKIQRCSRTSTHKTYNVGFYERKIDSVRLSVLDNF